MASLGIKLPTDQQIFGKKGPDDKDLSNAPGGMQQIAGTEQFLKSANKKLGPFADVAIGKFPFYVTGARALIKIGGKQAGVCPSISWRVAYTTTPINTIDTVHPWDIDVGQCVISASLTQIMDPTAGPEATGIFHIMPAAIHQPYVELQVLDRAFETSLFFARGMFTDVSAGVQIGQISTVNAQFVGVAYQHFVKQHFKPYKSIAGALSGMLNGLKGLASTATGGIL